MRPASSRPFRMSDAMIFLAAFALGFGLMRMCWPRDAPFSPHGVRAWGNATAGAVMIPLTFATLILGLRGPRPARVRLYSRPGMAACCAGSVAIVVGVCPVIFSWLHVHFTAPDQEWGVLEFARSFWFIYELPIGPAVAATWLALILSGRWRPRRGWLDRLGRFIGWFWIAFALLLQWQFGRWFSSLVQHIHP